MIQQSHAIGAEKFTMPSCCHFEIYQISLNKTSIRSSNLLCQRKTQIMRSAISAKPKVAANVRTFSFIAKHLSVFLLFFQQNFTLVKSKHCTCQIKTLHLSFQHLTAVGELCHCSGTALLPTWENFTTEVALHCYCRGTALLPQRENFATAVAMQCYCATEELNLLHLSLALQNNIFMCFVSA